MFACRPATCAASVHQRRRIRHTAFHRVSQSTIEIKRRDQIGFHFCFCSITFIRTSLIQSVFYSYVPSLLDWREFSKTSRPNINDLRFEEILNRIRPEKIVNERVIIMANNCSTSINNGPADGNGKIHRQIFDK